MDLPSITFLTLDILLRKVTKIIHSVTVLLMDVIKVKGNESPFC